MMLSLLIILLLTLSGAILTYIYEKDDSLMIRLAAGNVIGSTIYGLIVLLIACGFGFSSPTIILSVALSCLPLLLLVKKNWRKAFLADISRATKSLEGTNLKKILNFLYFAGFVVLFYFFFERAMFETPEGLFTGSSNNLGDLPFHLGAIFSFTEGNNFPPENPSFAFAKFTYPFIADLIVASFAKLGANLQGAFLAQNITLSLSLLVILEKFVIKLTGNRKAGKIACLMLMFSGGLGFVVFFRDYWKDGRSFYEFIWHMPDDYTIQRGIWRWGNSLTSLFMTQRAFLVGMPITLIALTKIWEIFSPKVDDIDEPGHDIEQAENSEANSNEFPISAFFVGLIAGTLPLVHVHSLAVLFLVCGFLFFFSLHKWREWSAFGVGVSLIAVPELIWTLTGSATRLKEFIGWNFGWDADDNNVFFFWAANLGMLIPLLFLAVACQFSAFRKLVRIEHSPFTKRHIVFYIPFVLIFIIANTIKLAPWEWDNIKVLIYWYLASLPFAAWILSRMWDKNVILKLVTLVCLFILTFSGALDVWRVMSKQVNYQVFNRDAMTLAEQIKEKTEPKAMFLNAPTYNSAVVLSGRRSLMRYVGHLSSYGIDYEPRYDEVKRIYEGSALAESFLKKNQIEYVIVSPEEPGWVEVNEEYFSKYPIIAEVGQYRVYKVK